MCSSKALSRLPLILFENNRCMKLRQIQSPVLKTFISKIMPIYKCYGAVLAQNDKVSPFFIQLEARSSVVGQHCLRCPWQWVSATLKTFTRNSRAEEITLPRKMGKKCCDTTGTLKWGVCIVRSWLPLPTGKGSGFVSYPIWAADPHVRQLRANLPPPQFTHPVPHPSPPTYSPST